MIYLTKKEFGMRMSLSSRTVNRWIAQRKIVARTLVSGGVRIPETELEKCFKPSVNELINRGKSSD